MAMLMRTSRVKLLLILPILSVCMLLVVVFSQRSSKRDLTVSWRACVQHANSLLEQEREQYKTDVEQEIESRVKEAFGQRSDRPGDATQRPITAKRSGDVHPRDVQTVSPLKQMVVKPYAGEISKILRQSHKPTYQGQTPSYDPLTEDVYVRNCITGQPLWQISRDVLLDEISLLEDQSEETALQRKNSFDNIYNGRQWGAEWGMGNDQESSLSGRGSSLRWSQEMSATLHTTINWLKIKLKKTRISLLDLPCGDMTWMERFLLTRDDIDYTGIDVVDDLINRHRKRYEPMPWRFLALDVVNETLPRSYDLVLNRMMLQHLYLPDSIKVLKHFSDSKSRYLLTTTFPREQHNMELRINKNNPGRFRPLNLELPPISLSPPLCLQRDGIKDEMEGWDHFIGLWKLPLQQDLSCGKGKDGFYPATDFTIYSCGIIHNI